MKAWLKGAIILELIVIIPSIVFSAFGFLSSNAEGRQATGLFVLFYLPIIIILSFLIGAIIGTICSKIVRNQKISPTSTGLKIGFWFGLILGILLWISWAYDNIWAATHVLGLVITPIGIVFVGVILGIIIGWIVGKIRESKK